MTHEKEIKELIEFEEKYGLWLSGDGDDSWIVPTADIDDIKAMYEENQRLKRRIAELEKANEWQPIETAPHGVWILICAYGSVMQACWNANGWWNAYTNSRIWPNHNHIDGWMPLPKPPEEKE